MSSTVYFRSITIEGFGSVIKPTTYRLDRVGINKIEGPNGSGKTTITNALAWVGWGQLVKPKKSSFLPWPHLLDSTFKGTCVQLDFDVDGVEYSIIRGFEYKGKIWNKKIGSRLIIAKDNEEFFAKGLRDKKDYQKWIIETIGYSFDLLKSTVLFTQELDNIMKEDGPGKKKIFDEAFETTFINVARKKVDDRIKLRAGEITKLEWNEKVLNEKIIGLRSYIQLSKQGIRDFQRNKDEQIRELEIEQNNLLSLLNEQEGKRITYSKSWLYADQIKDREKELTQLVSWEFRFNMNMHSAGNKVEVKQDEIRALIPKFTNPIKKCPVCGNSLSAEKVIEYKNSVKVEIFKTKKELRKLKKEHEELVYENKSYLKKVEKVKLVIAELKKRMGSVPSKEKMETEIQNIKDKLSELDSKIERAKAKKPPENDLTAQRKKLQKNKDLLLSNQADLKTMLRELKVDTWLMNDPLSNSGLKAFIFDSMMGKVNNYLKEYTQIIGFGIRVFVDLESANKDIRIAILRGGDEVPYEDISKGQKQLVLVVLAFSIGDAVDSIKPVNCKFLDELFESLDKENIEKVENIIIKKSKNKSIHLITHQAAFNPSNTHTTHVNLNSKHQTIISSS